MGQTITMTAGGIDPIDEGNALVMVDTRLMDAYWARSWQGHYFPPGADNTLRPANYAETGNRVAAGGDISFPETSLEKDGEAFQFVNGRHRVAWMRDNGYEAIPFSVPKKDAHTFRELFGSALTPEQAGFALDDRAKSLLLYPVAAQRPVPAPLPAATPAVPSADATSVDITAIAQGAIAEALAQVDGGEPEAPSPGRRVLDLKDPDTLKGRMISMKQADFVKGLDELIASAGALKESVAKGDHAASQAAAGLVASTSQKVLGAADMLSLNRQPVPLDPLLGVQKTLEETRKELGEQTRPDNGQDSEEARRTRAQQAALAAAVTAVIQKVIDGIRTLFGRHPAAAGPEVAPNAPAPSAAPAPRP